MTPETAEAMRRVRAHVDAWIAEFGEKGIYPRVGAIPSLSISDLNLVLKEAEGPHEWAAVVWHPNPEDGGIATAEVLQTFLTEGEAEDYASVSSVPKARVAHWDDNGHKSCWRAR